MVKRTYGVPPPPFPPAPPRTHQCGAPATTPKCMVCTTPTRCGTPALHTKGPRCIGRADGKDDCDCLNACGDDPWIESGRSMPCDHRRETQARIAALTTAAPAAVAWRELCRRLYVELFYCDQQMTSGKRPKWQQGKTVRDVLADAKAALDAAHQPSPAAQEGQ